MLHNANRRLSNQCHLWPAVSCNAVPYHVGHGVVVHVSHSDMQGIMRRMSSQEASGRLSMDSSILGGARYPRYTCWSGLRRVSLCAVSSARWSLCLASTVSWSECVQALAYCQLQPFGGNMCAYAGVTCNTRCVFPGCSGLSNMSASSEAPLTRAFSGTSALEQRGIARHSAAEASRLGARPPVPHPSGVRRTSPVALAARIAASSEHLLGAPPVTRCTR